MAEVHAEKKMVVLLNAKESVWVSLMRSQNIDRNLEFPNIEFSKIQVNDIFFNGKEEVCHKSLKWDILYVILIPEREDA